jgi:hypothetical protein
MSEVVPPIIATAISNAFALNSCFLSMFFTLRGGDIPAHAGRFVRPVPVYTPGGFFREAV